jgi:hypothetical protein
MRKLTTIAAAITSLFALMFCQVGVTATDTAVAGPFIVSILLGSAAVELALRHSCRPRRLRNGLPADPLFLRPRTDAYDAPLRAAIHCSRETILWLSILHLHPRCRDRVHAPLVGLPLRRPIVRLATLRAFARPRRSSRVAASRSNCACQYLL